MILRKLTLCILSVTPFLLLHSASDAGVVNTELENRLKGSKSVKIDINASENSRLRCWQRGNLLFDELDLESFAVANKKNAISFSVKKSANQNLYLIDLGESICLFREAKK